MFKNIRKNTPVWSTKRGWGKVKRVCKEEKCLLVEFKNHICNTYTLDGKDNINSKDQELFLKNKGD